MLVCGCKPDPAQTVNLGSEDLNPDLWTTLDQPTLGFKTKFPGKWKYKTEVMKTENGDAAVHIFEYWHVAFTYGITVVKLPEGASDMSDPDKVLEYAINSVADDNKGLVSYQQNIDVGGYPARRAMITLPDSYLKSARLNTMVILRNNFVYRISTSGVGNHDYIEYFMNSFQLTPVAITIGS